MKVFGETQIHLLLFVLLSSLHAIIADDDYDENIGIHGGLKKAAADGNHTAQYLLGLDYFFGQNEVVKDEDKGIDLMARAANAGETDAQDFMGKVLTRGHGNVKPSVFEGVRLAEQAAKKGKVSSMEVLGKAWYKGEGLEHVKEDDRLKKAFDWFRQAAVNHGSLQAQVDLGDCYRLGKGTKQDYKKAVQWYEKVTKMEATILANPSDKPSFKHNKTVIASAFNSLGGMTYAGTGVTKDFSQALLYMDKAAGLGHANAEKNAKVVREHIEKRKAKEEKEKKKKEKDLEEHKRRQRLDDDEDL